MIRRLTIALILGLALGGVAHAVEPDEILKSPVLESRARAISEGLRCLVCQNESIDDSHAALARDIRLLVRQRLQAGDTNAQVTDYLVSRYGQFILLRPPIEPATLLLWGTPLIVLLLGGGAMVLAARRRPTGDPARPLSDAERRRLDDVLAERT
jgi:cytochrome c-type biogenesis protein CcmH